MTYYKLLLPYVNMKVHPVSFCIPVFNEEELLEKKLNEISKGLTKIFGNNNYEIIIVENGSTDKTPELLKKIKNKHIRIFFSKQKGHGLAYKIAIKKSRFEHIVLSAIDLPFGFKDLIAAQKIWNTYDIIFGSKAHKKSVVYTTWQRNIASTLYRTMLKTLFGVKIKDTQGTIFLKKSSVMHILQKCNATDAFFTAELAIWGNKNNLRMTEIPVFMNKNNTTRKSKYNIFTDGLTMFSSLIAEKLSIKPAIIIFFSFLFFLIILAYAIASFGYALYWHIVEQIGVGAAYSIDQLTPLFVALFFGLLLIKNKILKNTKNYIPSHIFQLFIIILTTIVVRIWELGFYFFGEEPTSQLVSITNGDSTHLVTALGRGWHLGVYIGSYVLFGTNTLPYNIITFLIYLGSALLLYILLFKIFLNKTIALFSTLFYITTPAYLEMFYWQSNASGMSLVLACGILTMLFLYAFQQSNKKRYFFASLLFFIAVLKISFIRMVGFIVPLSFFAFFPNFSFKINIKKSFLLTLPFVIIWLAYFLTVFLIPDGVISKLLFSFFPQLNATKEATLITVRGNPINTQGYFVAFTTLFAYLFIPSQWAAATYFVIKNAIVTIFEGTYNPSITYILGIILQIIFLLLTILGLIKLKGKLRWLLLFSAIYILANIFYTPLFTTEYHNLISLDAIFSTTSPGSGPGIRYVFIASVGISFLIGILLTLLLNKSKKLFSIALFLLLVFFSYYSYLNIQNQRQALSDMTIQRAVPDKIFSMVPRNGKKKLLLSANPAMNAVDAKIGGANWLYAFYKYNELTYTTSLPHFLEIAHSFIPSNLYVFYNNPPTMAFKNISNLARNEIFSKKLPDIALLSSFSLSSQLEQTQNIFFIRRGEYISPDLRTRFFLPRNLTFTVEKNMQAFKDPYYDLQLIADTEKPHFPLSLWNYVENSPIVSYSNQLPQKLVLANSNTLISSFLTTNKEQAISVANLRETYRKEAQVAVSDIEPSSEGDPNINVITISSLFDGKYTIQKTGKGKFYRANTTPTIITITLPHPVILGRILLNVPPDSSANTPVDVSVINPQTQDVLFSEKNIESVPGSPNNGSLFSLTLIPELATSWEVHITKTARNPIMLDEIILDPQEALAFTPSQLLENKLASFHYVDSQDLLTNLISNSEFNSMTVFYACAENEDWNVQKKDFSEEVADIWKAVQIPMTSNNFEQVSTPINCYGSVLRKLIFIAPAYVGSFQIKNVSLTPIN